MLTHWKRVGERGGVTSEACKDAVIGIFAVKDAIDIMAVPCYL